MHPKARIVVELVILAVLAAAFLLAFPVRPIWADIGMASLAAGIAVAGSPRFERRYAVPDPPASANRGLRHSFAVVLGATSVVLALMLLVGAAISGADSGWPGVLHRLGNGRFLLAVVLYFPWALLQQTLFQRYLFARLRVLFPGDPPGLAIVLTGAAYSLVHLPDPGLAAVTALAGVGWTYLYYRLRVLTPLAVSHAILGTALYYWIYGRDLVAHWLEAVT